MTAYNTFELSTSQLKSIEPLLDEYFGISYGYFTDEIEQIREDFSKLEAGESPTNKALELDKNIIFATSMESEPYLSMFNVIEEEDDDDGLIVLALFMLAYIVFDKDWSWEFQDQDYTHYLEYHEVREDLLKLFIYSRQPKPKTADGQKIVIKHSTGNIEIKNYENWFSDRLIQGYLNKYLSDIETVEQAERELQTNYKKKAGRQAKDPRIGIIAYGIFRMFNDKKKMKSPQSESLCELIRSFLKFVDLIRG